VHRIRVLLDGPVRDDDVKVTGVLVQHGAVFPAFGYRFETEHGSVVFYGDTAMARNIIALAAHTDVLVHEALYRAGLASLGGLPQAPLIDHITSTHTDVAELGRIAAEPDAGTLVATHLGPGRKSAVSDATWRRLLRDSARRADFGGGQMVPGTDLLHLPVRRRGSRRS
jgi:ribonuclease BN (tRNA processing enzyme)